MSTLRPLLIQYREKEKERGNASGVPAEIPATIHRSRSFPQHGRTRVSVLFYLFLSADDPLFSRRSFENLAIRQNSRLNLSQLRADTRFWIYLVNYKF
ncbi:hypothetical protein V1477_006909 [Vespula maculifrons]|uniref:Uncharacterized protein n=1 Tax=Vespula maculifrons TaxID=7453 RepID=A0ABD2CH11_VESMC